MPTYDYRCAACGRHTETYQSFHADPLTTCPECGCETLGRVLHAPTVFDATPRTVGSVADRNSGPGRGYWLEERRRDVAESRRRGIDEINAGLPAGMKSAREDADVSYKPFWRDGKINAGLTALTPEQKANYIATGDSRG